MSLYVPSVIPNDWNRLRLIIDKLKHLRLGTDSDVTYAGLTLTDLTASRLIATDADKLLVSSDLYSWVTQTANQVLIADDGDGTITFSTPQDIDATANPQFNSINLGSATYSAVSRKNINVVDTSINSIYATFGLYIEMSKTAGATNVSDDFTGMYYYADYDQTGGTIGDIYGTFVEISVTDGDIGSGASDKEAIALRQWLDVGSSGGKVYGEAYGIQSTNIIRGAGEVTADVFGIYNDLILENSATLGADVYGYKQDLDAGTADITGDMYGLYLEIDNDATLGGTAYQIYSKEWSNIDYFIYQDGTAPSTFGGDITAKDLYLTDFAGGAESIDEILDDIIPEGILDAFTVNNAGGIQITWSAGEVWDSANKAIVEVTAEATPQNCTDDAVNYLKWAAGTTLTLNTTPPSGVEVIIASINCADGDIWEINQIPIVSDIIGELAVAFQEIFPSLVSSGLIVSEHAADEAFDVDMTSGVYFNRIYGREAVSAQDSSIGNDLLITWYKSAAGEWTATADQSEIDETQWNNGTALAAVGTPYWYRSLFFITSQGINWVYPTAQYTTKAQAIAAPDPELPAGLTDHPKSTVLILQWNAAALPAAAGDQWIDVRPIIGSTVSGDFSDHANLTSLAFASAGHTGFQAQDDVLDDLSALAVVADNQFIVGSGAGTFGYESTTTARTTLGIGEGDSPTLAGLSLGTGELTCGSINRVADTLTLEINGTPQISITSTTVTFAGAVDITGAITGATVDADTDFTVGATVITDGVITDATGLSLTANVTITGTITCGAFTTTVVSDTDNTDALGTAAIGWSDLFLGNLSVITWSTAPSTADVTLTHSTNTLTFAGGTIVLGTATAAGGLTGDVTGNCSGQAGTVATITGLAPDTATDAAAQPNITSVGTLTSLSCGAITSTGLLGVTVAGNTAILQNTTDAASNQVAQFKSGNRATAANDDSGYISLFCDNDAGTQMEMARLKWIIGAVGVGSEEGALDIQLESSGGGDLQSILLLDHANNYALFSTLVKAPAFYAKDPTTSNYLKIQADAGEYAADRLLEIDLAEGDRVVTFGYSPLIFDQPVRIGASPTFVGLTLSGDLLVDGGDIGITGDIDLMQLAAGALTVNGTLASGPITITADGTYGVRINQGADSGGLKIYGYDDQNNDYFQTYIDSSGNCFVKNVGGQMWLQPGGTFVFQAFAAKDMYFNLGDSVGAEKVQFRNYASGVICTVDSLGSLKLKERNTAAASEASLGQLWIKDDGPNILMFTDDAGTDFTVDVTAV